MGMAVGSVDTRSEITAIELDSFDLPYKGYLCPDSSATQTDEKSQKGSALKSEETGSNEANITTQETPSPLAGLQWQAKLRGCGWKRLSDMLGALALIIVTSPIMLVTFLVIRAQDGGASIFAQNRVGLHGQTFKCLKFRSMVADAEQRLQAYLAENPDARDEWEKARKLKDDPRITRFGHFIRRSSIDELPQLFNVLRGDMSLVGPRPVVPDEMPRYGMQAIHYLRVRPGLTGLWQVSGRSDTSYETRVLLDREYAMNRTFWSDIGIMFRTIPAVLKSHGAV